jgi:glycosyltransferase involved in cell wall biosynthesis
VKICIVGPLGPFQGGIAQHTESLLAALRDAQMEVSVLSFKFLYPRFLYPGNGITSVGSTSSKKQFILNTINPLSWFRAKKIIAAERPDILVLQAWTFFVAPCLYWLGKSAKKSDIEVVTIVHNTVDHEATSWKAWLINKQLAVSDRFITHDRSQRHFLRTLFENKPTTVHPLPTKPAEQPVRRSPNRRELSVLFFGFVRPYKGLEVALSALSKTKNCDISMVVAGEFWTSVAEARALIKTLGIAKRVTLKPRFIEEWEVAQHFRLADVVVLPYHKVTSSAVLSQAYNYRVPVIVSNQSGLADSVQSGVTGWVLEENTPECLGRLLDQLNPDLCERMGPSIAAYAQMHMGWETYVEAVVGVSTQSSHCQESLQALGSTP